MSNQLKSLTFAPLPKITAAGIQVANTEGVKKLSHALNRGTHDYCHFSSTCFSALVPIDNFRGLLERAVKSILPKAP